MVAPLSIKDFVALVEKARVMEKMKNEAEGQRPQRSQRIGGPSGSKPRHEERRKPCNNLTISLRGLGTYLPNRADYSVSYVEALI